MWNSNFYDSGIQIMSTDSWIIAKNCTLGPSLNHSTQNANDICDNYSTSDYELIALALDVWASP